MGTLTTNPLHLLASLRPRNQLYSGGFWLTLVLFAVLFGVLLARIAAPYQRTGHVPQWDQAGWIGPAKDSAIAYYRREWTIDAVPTQAYLQVEAPDSLTVYINGLKVGNVEQPSTAVFDLMDVGNYLLPGKNVIAIRVERKTFPGSAGLLASLRWQDKTGLRQDLPSDDKWRVALREERQNGGALFWYERSFDDSNWVQASGLKNPDNPLVHPAHPWASPELFHALPRGAWISNGHPVTGGVSFLRQFDLGSLGNRDIQSAWLGVASTGAYTVIINGVHGPTIDPSNQYMDTYDIGSFLFAGTNTIEINTSTFDGIGRLAVSLLVNNSRELLDLSSNEDWRVRGYGSEWEPVTVMGGLKSYPFIEEKTGKIFPSPILRLAEIWLPGGLLLRHFIAAIPWIMGVFVLTLMSIVLRLSRESLLSRDVITTSVLPWKLANLALCVVFLLPLDLRISEVQIFSLSVALAIASLTYVLFFLIMSEINHGHS